MAPTSPIRLLVLAAAAAAMVGCGSVAPGLYTKVTPAIAAKPEGAPIVHVITSTEAAPVIAPNAAAVNLEVSFGDASSYRVQDVGDLVVTPGATGTAAATGAAAATTPNYNIPADLAKVNFVVTYGNAAPITYTVTRAQFLQGQAVIQLNNLPAGSIHCEAAALRADGTTIVSASGDSTIVVGQLTILKLQCHIPSPGPTPTPQGVGHIRITDDCWTSGQCNPTPTPSPVPVATPTVFVPVPVSVVTFHSQGDPHEEGANGLTFENQKAGTFLAMQTLTHDLSIVKQQGPDPAGHWAGTTLNHAIGITSGSDTFIYYLFNHRARLNGAVMGLTAGASVTAPGGMTITRQASSKTSTTFRLVTPQGDALTVVDFGAYLDLQGTIGQNRVVNEVSGELGTFNNGKAQDGMLLRDGSAAGSLDAFLTNWIATASEDVITANTAEVVSPATIDETPLDPAVATN